MAGFPKPPPAAKGCPIVITSVDASTFDTDGKLAFMFAHDGKDIGRGHLTIQLTKYCRDELPKLVFFLKDCRPVVDLTVLNNAAYLYDSIPVTKINKIFTFNARLKETDVPNDSECKMVYLIIEVFSQTDVVTNPQGQGAGGGWGFRFDISLGLTPVLTWTIPLKFCCHNCELTCIFDPAGDA